MPAKCPESDSTLAREHIETTTIPLIVERLQTKIKNDFASCERGFQELNELVIQPQVVSVWCGSVDAIVNYATDIRVSVDNCEAWIDIELVDVKKHGADKLATYSVKAS